MERKEFQDCDQKIKKIQEAIGNARATAINALSPEVEVPSSHSRPPSSSRDIEHLSVGFSSEIFDIAKKCRNQNNLQKYNFMQILFISHF